MHWRWHLGVNLLALLVLCLFPFLPARAAAEAAPVVGRPLGITPQGNVTRLAVDSHDDRIVFAGTASSGIFRSGNGGATWKHATLGLPPGSPIAGMVLDPTQQNVAYVATATGVYRSADGGAYWATKGPPTASPSTAVALVPGSNGTILAGTAGDGIYRSANGGLTWAAIGPSRATIEVVLADPGLGSPIYAGTTDGLLISVANGTWRRAGLGHVAVQALAISANAPQTVYVGTNGGILLSTDGGDTWTRDGLRDHNVTTLYASPKDSRLVYAGSSDGEGLYRSTNGGQVWQKLTAGLSTGNIYSLAVDPRDPSIAYAGLNQGVFKSLQAGVSWASSSIYDRSVLSLVQPNGALEQYYAGTNSGIYASGDGAVWTSAGLGNHEIRDVLALAPTRPVTSTTLIAATEAGVYVSNDQGHIWGHTLLFPARAVQVDRATGHLYAGTTAGLFTSVDRGTHWSFLNAGSSEIDALLVQPGRTVYAGGSAGVIWQALGQASFQRSQVADQTVVQLLWAPDLVTILARTDNGDLYRSADYHHWTQVNVGGESITALTVGTDKRLYAATSRGIYLSSSLGSSWIHTDQQDATLQPLVLQPTHSGKGPALLEGLSRLGIIVRSPSVTPVSPLAPLPNGTGVKYFPLTGHFVRSPFLDWYTRDARQTVLGLPRTEARNENGRLVQYFQNAVLVYQPDKADTPLVIGLVPLGQQMLGTSAAKPIPPFDNTTTRRFFPQTGHSLQGQFLSYWRQYGGIEVFGLPISEPLTSNGVVVQYFQNARFEADDSVPAEFFGTRLSALGDRVMQAKGWLR